MHSNEDLGKYTGYLSGVGSVESAYLLQATRSITEHRDWDLPALLTAIQYLTQLEVRRCWLSRALFLYSAV